MRRLIINSEYVWFGQKVVAWIVLYNSTEETEESHGKPQSDQLSNRDICLLCYCHTKLLCVSSTFM
jgi:hypothetical protein